MWHTSPCGAIGVSREAAGLPWKRETTMERGGCHYLFNENDSSGSGSSCGVRLVWRRVTGENVMVYLGMYGMWPKGGYFVYRDRACVAPSDLNGSGCQKLQPQLAKNLRKHPSLANKNSACKTFERYGGPHHRLHRRHPGGQRSD